MWVDQRPKLDFIIAHKVLQKTEWQTLLATKNTAVVKNGEFIHVIHPTEEEIAAAEAKAEADEAAEIAAAASKKRGGRKKTKVTVTKRVAVNIEERFLVKWKGYSYVHTSWETRETILTLIYRAEQLGKNRLTSYWSKHDEGSTEPFTYGYMRCHNPDVSGRW